MTQYQALKIMLSGDSVFLTGPPGSGKTFLLKQFISQSKRKKLNVAITATTGIAATYLDGTTIHSWAGIGLNDDLGPKEKKRLLANTRLANRYITTDILVIDEVSMLDRARLDLINELAKMFRGNDKPMGGIQLILVGDLFQLPPVSDLTDPYIFKSKAWAELDLKVCYLSDQYRQLEGDELNTILASIRSNRVGQIELSLLKSKLDQRQPIRTILKLYSHNFDADQINQYNLGLLKGRQKLYKMRTKGSKKNVDDLKRSIISPIELYLKTGSEVIFTANNYSLGYVNGDRARVVGFKAGYPIVRMNRSAYLTVKEHHFRREVDSLTIAEAWQLPLKLAWAITIHKSQGMSLEEAQIDLSRAFSAGMGYVALSRLRTINGLYLLGFNKMSLYVNPEIVKFDKILRDLSDKLVLR